MELSEKIKQLRRAKNQTQKELAKKIGVSQSAIAYFESNKTELSLSQLRRIAVAFEVPLQEILFGVDSGISDMEDIQNNDVFDTISKLKPSDTLTKPSDTENIRVTPQEDYVKEKEELERYKLDIERYKLENELNKKMIKDTVNAFLDSMLDNALGFYGGELIKFTEDRNYVKRNFELVFSLDYAREELTHHYDNDEYVYKKVCNSIILSIFQSVDMRYDLGYFFDNQLIKDKLLYKLYKKYKELRDENDMYGSKLVFKG